MSSIFVEILSARGSVPRDAGTAMEVTANAIRGTIGGGALEHQAIAHARQLLGATGIDEERSIALGPSLGQCCGGAVTLRFTTERRTTDAPKVFDTLPAPVPIAPIWIWGAGHVGRAVVRALDGAASDVTWVDTSADRFPDDVPACVTVLPAANMAQLARHAPVDAHHMIFTYSHDIDFALCATLRERNAIRVGLIGSETKKTRFFKRLRALGLDPAPIQCPIGDKRLGKHPDEIAHGVVRELIGEVCTA